MPIPRLALKHTAVQQFSGKQPKFTAWTIDARYYAQGVGFLSAFVSDPPQYVPVGDLDTETSVLVGRGYNRECVHTCTRLEFLIDGPKEQVRQEYLAQVHERSVGRAPRVVRPSNDGGQTRPLPPPQ